ncbi:MAG: HAMP domain-containing histidine kinase [Actinobacteria bacterium]|nr:HAMP domain-containing histidine kinase [Actinomycetota bacterium]
MKLAVDLVGIVNLVLFAAIAVVAVGQLRREQGRSSVLWAALAFVALALVALAAAVLPEQPESLVAKAVQRVELAMLVLFPYFLYRFAASFEAASRPLPRFIGMLTSALVFDSFLLPHLPGEGDSWPWWFGAYVVAFLIHWALLLFLVSVRLWRAGSQEATVARRRMKTLAAASMAATAALVLAFETPDAGAAGMLLPGLVVMFSALSFLVGLAPPGLVRVLWRRPEQERVQHAIGQLMTATTEDDVAARVLPSMARIVGARGILLEAKDGSRIGEYGSLAPEPDSELSSLEFPFGRLLVRTTGFAPVFGAEERKLLYSLGALTGVALDRARLFSQERDAREALERADALKSQFVALAAHELRSPVGAIYGLSETIELRRGELRPEQVEQLQTKLTAQIRRMRDLVEQLLDLSRLEAAAVEIRPERVRVRDRLAEIVESAAPMQADRIGIEADPGLEADIDFAALDRIVSNLVVNACRYGEPPVTVSAERDHGLLRVVVRDSGEGVPEDFVPRLFDRFARSAATAAQAEGTGLGLAIARSYARAHRGDVTYSPARPRGAAFELTLPALTAA